MTVAGLLLAAGGGSRLGMPKALVDLDGRLLVERGARTLAGAGCDPVVVVLGAAAEQVRRRADLTGARVVTNPAWREGIGASLRAGLAALHGAPAAVVALVDQPQVGPALVTRLVEAWTPETGAVVATYDGKPRNPVVLAADVWAEVAELAVGDVGARAWLRRHPDRVRRVACDDLGTEADIDTVTDLARLGRTSA